MNPGSRVNAIIDGVEERHTIDSYRLLDISLFEVVFEVGDIGL